MKILKAADITSGFNADKFDVYAAKIGECRLNLIRGFGCVAASNLTQILRAFESIKIISSKRWQKLKFKAKFKLGEQERLAKNASQALDFYDLFRRDRLKSTCKDYFKLSMYSLTAAISSSLRFLACRCMTLPMPKLLFEPSL